MMRAYKATLENENEHGLGKFQLSVTMNNAVVCCDNSTKNVRFF